MTDEVVTAAAALLPIRVAITNVVTRALLGLVVVDALVLFTGFALTDSRHSGPPVTPTPWVLVAISTVAIGAFLIVGTIGVIRLGALRRQALGRLRREPGLIIVLAIAVVNFALLIAAWLLPPAAQLPYLSRVGMLGIAVFVIGLVQVTRAQRLPSVPADSPAVTLARADVTERPGDPQSWAALARALAASNRTADAAAAARERVRLEPDDWVAHVQHSELSDSWWVRDEGLESAREAVRLAPDESLAHHNLGNAHLRRSQNREARAAFTAALAIDPMNADAVHNLALTELTRSPAAAAVGLTDTVRLDPMHSLVTRNLRVALARVLSRVWYLLIGAGVIALATVVATPRWGWPDTGTRALLCGLDLVVLVVVAMVLRRTVSAGRLRSLVRFAIARDRWLAFLGWVLVVGLSALIAVALLPPIGQILMFALLFGLFIASRFAWFIWALNVRSEPGDTSTS